MDTITREELKRMLDNGEDVVVIDLQAKPSFEMAHIPTAINLPLDEPHFIRRVRAIAPRYEQRVVVYCISERDERCAAAARRLTAGGYSTILHYEDGTEGWRAARYLLEGRAFPHSFSVSIPATFSRFDQKPEEEQKDKRKKRGEQ